MARQRSRRRGARSGRAAGRRPSRAAATVAGLVALVACVALGVGIRMLAGNGPLAADLAWQDFSRSIRTPWLDSTSIFLNVAGSRTVLSFLLPVAAALVLAARRAPWSAVAVLLCCIASAPLVDGLKSVLQRPRPEDQAIAVSLSAYPSGHVANLTVLVVIAVLMIATTWAWIAGAVLVLAMGFSRTYLGVHWLSDDLGGALLGAGLALLVYGILADRITAETRLRR